MILSHSADAVAENVRSTLVNFLGLPSQIAVPLLRELRRQLLHALLEGAERTDMPDIAELLLEDLLTDQGLQVGYRIQIVESVRRELTAFTYGCHDADWLDAS